MALELYHDIKKKKAIISEMQKLLDSEFESSLNHYDIGAIQCVIEKLNSDIHDLVDLMREQNHRELVAMNVREAKAKGNWAEPPAKENDGLVLHNVGGKRICADCMTAEEKKDHDTTEQAKCGYRPNDMAAIDFVVRTGHDDYVPPYLQHATMCTQCGCAEEFCECEDEEITPEEEECEANEHEFEEE